MKGFRNASRWCCRKYIGRLRKGAGVTEHATALLIGVDFLARSGSALFLAGFLLATMIYTIVKEEA